MLMDVFVGCEQNFPRPRGLEFHARVFLEKRVGGKIRLSIEYIKPKINNYKES